MSSYERQRYKRLTKVLPVGSLRTLTICRKQKVVTLCCPTERKTESSPQVHCTRNHTCSKWSTFIDQYATRKHDNCKTADRYGENEVEHLILSWANRYLVLLLLVVVVVGSQPRTQMEVKSFSLEHHNNVGPTIDGSSGRYDADKCKCHQTCKVPAIFEVYTRLQRSMVNMKLAFLYPTN